MDNATGVLKTIPTSQTEYEEIEFWDTHDPDGYFEAEPLEDVIVVVKPQSMKR